MSVRSLCARHPRIEPARAPAPVDGKLLAWRRRPATPAFSRTPRSVVGCLHPGRRELSDPHPRTPGGLRAPPGVGAGSLPCLRSSRRGVSSVLDQNAAVLGSSFTMPRPDELRRRVELARAQGYAVQSRPYPHQLLGCGRRDPLSGGASPGHQHCRHRQPDAGAAARANWPALLRQEAFTHREQARRAVP